MASRLLFCGYCTALDWVILPPCTVICTWTGPQRVFATSPVKVAGLDLDVEDPPLFEDLGWAEPEVAGCCTKGLPATAALSVEVW